MRFQPVQPPPANKKWERASADCIEHFLQHGSSTHSINGTLLAPLLNWCVANKIAFTLRYLPNGGYSVVKEDHYAC